MCVCVCGGGGGGGVEEREGGSYAALQTILLSYE